jgi:hypothetical protein
MFIPDPNFFPSRIPEGLLSSRRTFQPSNEIVYLIKKSNLFAFQCCGFGSGIRCFLIPGSGMGKIFWIRIRHEHPRSFFRELGNSFYGLKIHKFFDGSGIWYLFDLGSGMEKFGSGINIPDPQHSTLFSAISDCPYLNLAFHHHPPEVVDGVGQRTLARNIRIAPASS